MSHICGEKRRARPDKRLGRPTSRDENDSYKLLSGRSDRPDVGQSPVVGLHRVDNIATAWYIPAAAENMPHTASGAAGGSRPRPKPYAGSSAARLRTNRGGDGEAAAACAERTRRLGERETGRGARTTAWRSIPDRPLRRSGLPEPAADIESGVGFWQPLASLPTGVRSSPSRSSLGVVAKSPVGAKGLYAYMYSVQSIATMH